MLPEDLSEQLSAYLDGELSARQRAVVVRLLDESEEARFLLGKLERDAVQVRQLPARKLSYDLTDAILGTIAATEAPHHLRLPIGEKRLVRSKAPTLPRYAAAAAVLVAVGLGCFAFLGEAGQGTPEVAFSSSTNSDGAGGGAKGASSGDAPEVEPVIGPEVPHRPGSQSVFAFPSRKATELRPAQVRVPFVQSLREVEAGVLREHLQPRVRDSALHIDLYCADPSRAVERLGAACIARRIRINVDPSAADRLESQPQAALAVYVENVTPAKVADILQELGDADRQRTSRLFSTCVVNAGPVTPEDVAKVLGGPARDFAPPSQRPLELGTVGEIAHSLPGQGANLSPSEKLPHRLAVIVPVRSGATAAWFAGSGTGRWLPRVAARHRAASACPLVCAVMFSRDAERNADVSLASARDAVRAPLRVTTKRNISPTS